MKSFAVAALLLASATLPAVAQSPAPAIAPPAGRAGGLSEQTITYGELFAIGTGAVIGSALAVTVFERGIGIAGTLLGAWVADRLYFQYVDPAPASAK